MQGASCLTSSLSVPQQYPQFARLLMVFAGVAVPAACVNSGLKYFQKRIQLTFMRRLTHNLHQQYTANRAYYAASTLGGAHAIMTLWDHAVNRHDQALSTRSFEHGPSFAVFVCRPDERRPAHHGGCGEVCLHGGGPVLLHIQAAA